MAKSKAKKTKRRKTAGARGIIIVGGKKGRPGSSRMLNPQPLPPKTAKRKKKKSAK